TVPGGPFDSAGEDCSTGIAVSSIEGQDGVFLADLTQTSYAGTTFSAPYVIAPRGGFDGITVAQGSHLAFGMDEAGSGMGVLELPATSGSGTPALVDYATATVPSFASSLHGVAAYVSPANGKAYGVA